MSQVSVFVSYNNVEIQAMLCLKWQLNWHSHQRLKTVFVLLCRCHLIFWITCILYFCFLFCANHSTELVEKCLYGNPFFYLTTVQCSIIYQWLLVNFYFDSVADVYFETWFLLLVFSQLSRLTRSRSKKKSNLSIASRCIETILRRSRWLGEKEIYKRDTWHAVTRHDSLGVNWG